MDLHLILGAVAAGGLIGLATGLVPGLHVNTLAALALVLPWHHPWVPLVVLAAGIVHTFVTILPATYLGAPDPATALATLPAHRMLRFGQAPSAVAVSAQASLLALVAVVLFLAPYRWLMDEPGRLLPRIEAGAPWLLAATILVLVAQERRGGLYAVAWALLLHGLAGGLGLLTLDLPLRGLVPGASSPLLPVLAGLFGAPTLIWSLRQNAPTPLQDPPQPLEPTIRRAAVRATGIGVIAASVTAVLPGVTAAVATAVSRAGTRDEPVPIIASLSAVNTAHAAFAIWILASFGNVRSGLAAYLDASTPAPPAAWIAVMLGAGVVGYVGTRTLDPLFSKHITRLPARTLSAGALAVLAATTLALTGPAGLLLWCTATTLGLVPLAAGVRRVHLAGVLLVPVLLARLDVAI